VGETAQREERKIRGLQCSLQMPHEHRQERRSAGGTKGTEFKVGSRPVSRVLSGTAIHLRRTSPCACSDLPGNSAGHAIVPLFGLAPGGVYRAAKCCHPRGALLPHLFTLTCAPKGHRRYVFCGTFRRLAPPRRYLAPCPMEPGLSSTPRRSGCPAGFPPLLYCKAEG